MSRKQKLRFPQLGDATVDHFSVEKFFTYRAEKHAPDHCYPKIELIWSRSGIKTPGLFPPIFTNAFSTVLSNKSQKSINTIIQEKAVAMRARRSRP